MASAGKLVLPFDTSPRVKSRYENLAAVGEEEEGEEAKEYAAFLREQERKCGPDGFLDSSKYTHSFKVRGKVLESKTNKPKRNTDVLSRSVKIPQPEKQAEEQTEQTKSKETVVNLKEKVKKDEKDFEKKLKLIEDHMWQHRQEERDLKRLEGDVMKTQTILKRTMRDYEIAIQRKKMAEEKKILDNKQKEFFITREHVHTKENMTKENIEKSTSKNQLVKDEDRKVFLSIGDLERKYRSKISEIELRRTEVQRLSEEFEQKMKQKEEETFMLNKELADLTLSINMEMKKRGEQNHDNAVGDKSESDEKWKTENEMEQKLNLKVRQNRGKVNQFENNKRRLSLEISKAKGQMEEKIRDEGRQLLDTKNRLQDNSVTQRKLQEVAMFAKLDHTTKQIEHKIMAHESRKQRRLQNITLKKKDEHAEGVAKWQERFTKRQFEAQRRENEDHMKHATKIVNKLEETEYNLSNQVREAELNRKQREQVVKRLMNKLSEMKRKNAEKIKREMTEMSVKEKELEQRLLREQAELYKSHVNREEGYFTLQQHRMKMQEDKNILSEVSREHQRLLRIGERTDVLSSFP